MTKYLLIISVFLQLTLLSNDALNTEFNFQKNKEIHHVRIDETLARIALENKVSVAFLLYLNEDIKNPDLIYAGQKINIPNVKAREFIIAQSKVFMPFINKMGAMKYKERKKAINEMIKKDWLVIPVLLQALEHKDVEIRENARLALREIHRKKEKVATVDYSTKEN